MRKTVAAVFVLLLACGPLAARRLPPSFQVGAAEGVLWELKQVPRPGPFAFQTLPAVPCPPDSLLPSKYDPDHGSLGDIKRSDYDPDQYPLRAAALMTLRALVESQPLSVRSTLRGPKVDLKGKQQLLREQMEIGAVIFRLEELQKKLPAAVDRAREKSARWQAHYDYVAAALQARLIFCYEYNFLLARARAENLPPLLPGHSGWRVAVDKNLQIIESKVRNLNLDMSAAYRKLQHEHPGTPWALQAEAEERLERGLVWVPYRE